MRDVLLVGAGGFVGSVARYLLGGLVTQMTAAARAPVGTIVVNVAGCLCIGAVSAYVEQTQAVPAHIRLMVITGVLGGFTTYSAFAYESWFLARENAWLLAGGTILVQVVLGFAAVWLGHSAVQTALRQG